MSIVKYGMTQVGSRIPNSTAGSVLFIDANGKLGEDNAGLFWDITNGRLGIGTATPSNKLSVTPTQYSTGTASQSTTTITGSGTTFTSAMVGSQFVFADGTSAGTITAFTDTTHLTVSASQTVASQDYNIAYTGLQVDSSGKVGIGTVAPYSKMEINGGASGGVNDFIGIKRGNTDWRIWASDGYAAGVPSLRIGGNAIDKYAWQFAWSYWSANVFRSPNAVAAQHIMEILGTVSQTGDYFNISSSGGAIGLGDILKITSTGKVGIGTTGPGELLHVYKTGGHSKLKVESATDNANIIVDAPADEAAYYSFYTAGVEDWTITRPISQTYLQIAKSGITGLVMNTSGNVGIGTTAPDEKLDIRGTLQVGVDGATAGKIRFMDSGSITSEPEIYTDTLGSLSYYVNSGSGEHHFYTYSNQERVTILQDGNVGIGTTTPDTKLQVVGISRFGEDTTNYSEFESDGTLEFNGTATVWEDLRVPISSIKRLGFSDPDWVKFADDAGGTSVGIYALAFDNTTDEEVFFTAQIPHAYKEGTDITPHVHWAPSDANAGGVTWGLEYVWANQDGTYGDTVIITADDATDTTSHKHHRIDFAVISGAGKTISSVLMCRLFRDISDDNDTYAHDAFLLEFDFHFEKDTVGSRAILTK